MQVPVVSTAPEDDDADTEDIYGQLQKVVNDTSGGASLDVYAG